MSDLHQTASLPEIIWSLATLLAIVLIAVPNVLDAVGDLRLLIGKNMNGSLRIVAVGAVEVQASILFVLLCNLLIGVLAMLSLPGREPDGDPSLGSIFSPWLFIASAVALGYMSISIRSRRRQTIRAILVEIGEEERDKRAEPAIPE